MASSGSLRQRHPPSEPPPSYEECVGNQAPSVPPLSQDEARQALMREINKRWFVSRSPAIEFEFVRMAPSTAYRYELESFTEQRRVGWAYTPYTGQRLDGPESGREPEMWSLPSRPDCLFQDCEKQLEVPHTASVVVCHECRGVGRDQCWKCKGAGRVACAPCKGSGRVPNSPQPDKVTAVEGMTCQLCRGSGMERCTTCNQSGEVRCELCETHGRLKKYRKLTVTWKKNSIDRVIELTGLDHKCLREAQGRTLLEDERQKVTPITDFPVPAMNLASEELIRSQGRELKGEKIIMQRQRVFFIPVHEVTGNWKGKEFTYWVYGTNNAANCPDYPGNTCDCCTIL